MHFISLIILYIILWFKANSKPLFGFNLAPWEWWLYTGLITNYLGITAWWHLIDKYNIWPAMAITYIMHTLVETGLNFYFFEPPTIKQSLGLLLLFIGGLLVLK